jgi:DNA-binding FrmR family transcriptional regulator
MVIDQAEASRKMLLKRLRRIEGQIRGIHKMITDDRDCVSVMMQLAAVRSGIEGVGALVLNNCMKSCFYEGPDAATDINSLARAVAIWGRVRGGDLAPEMEQPPKEEPKRRAKSNNA